MKKILLLVLLTIPFFVFASDTQNLSDQEIKEKIIGRWSMFEIGRQANIVTYNDNGTVSLKYYICDNNAKKALYAGEQIQQYKIEDGYIYTGQFIEDGFVYKLKVVSMKSPSLSVVYDTPGYSYDKIEVNYLKTTNMDIPPFCKYSIEKPAKIEDNKSQLQTDLNLIQDKFIEQIKSVITLPMDLDEYTVLQDIYKSNNELFFKLDIKNATKDKFNDPVFGAFLRVIAVNKFCSISASPVKILQNVKLIFPNGSSYIYSFEDEEPIVIHVDNSSCQEQ